MDPLIVGCGETLEKLAFCVGDIQETADGISQFLAIRRHGGSARRLFCERASDRRISGRYRDHRDGILTGCGIQQMDFIVKQIDDPGTVPRNAWILDRPVEMRQLFRFPSRCIADDIGFLVLLISYIVQCPFGIYHGPRILALIIGQRCVLLLSGVPGLDVRIVVAHVALPGREIDTLGRFVEIESTVFGILHQVDDRGEVAVEQQLRRSAR